MTYQSVIRIFSVPRLLLQEEVKQNGVITFFKCDNLMTCVSCAASDSSCPAVILYLHSTCLAVWLSVCHSSFLSVILVVNSLDCLSVILVVCLTDGLFIILTVFSLH